MGGDPPPRTALDLYMLQGRCERVADLQKQRGDLGVLNHHRLPASGLRRFYEDGHSAANRIRLRTCVRHVPNTHGRNLADAEPAIMR